VGALWLVLSACGGEANAPPGALGDVPFDAGPDDELPSSTGGEDDDGGAMTDPDGAATVPSLQ
jgi:hypothetical protein